MAKENESKSEEKKTSVKKEEFTPTAGGGSIRSRTSNWFECKVSYQKTMEDGSEKMVTELYTVDALSFAEAEAKIIDELSVYVSGEMKVKNINPAPYGEIFFSGVSDDDLWFKARLAFITIDEKTEKEKRSYVTYLIQAKSLARALRYVDEVMGKTMIDYDTVVLNATKIMDVFEYRAKTQKKKEKDKK